MSGTESHADSENPTLLNAVDTPPNGNFRFVLRFSLKIVKIIFKSHTYKCRIYITEIVNMLSAISSVKNLNSLHSAVTLQRLDMKVCTHLHIRGHEFTCILCCKSKYIHPQVLETNESHLRVSTGKIITLLSTDVEKFHLVSRLPKPNPSVSAYFTSNISRYYFLSLQSSMHQIALLHCVKFIVSK